MWFIRWVAVIRALLTLFYYKMQEFCSCSPSTVKFLPPTPPPLVLFSPSPFCQVFWQHNTQQKAIRDESKVFSTLNTEGRWKLVNNTIFLLDLYEEIYFLFFYIPKAETAEISNATLYVLSLQPILSLNNISMCGYLFTQEIITVTSETCKPHAKRFC